MRQLNVNLKKLKNRHGDKYMTDINNLPNIGGKIEKIQPKPVKIQEECTCADEAICDCPKSDIKAGEGVIGQSQVKRPESILTDIEFCMKHPELVEKSDIFFELALEDLISKNDPDAYEKACTLTDSFARELAQQS